MFFPCFKFSIRECMVKHKELLQTDCIISISESNLVVTIHV